MTLFIVSIPLMVLALAIATVPLIVAMIGEQKQRNHADAGDARSTRAEDFHVSSQPRTAPARRGDSLVGAGPRTRFF
jgi:hypothetical protein